MVFDIAFPRCFCMDSICNCEVSDDPTGNSTTSNYSAESEHTQKRLLFHAVLYDQSEVLDQLLKVGANPNVSDGDGTPLLHAAIEKGNVEVIETLIQNGCNVNQCDKNGQTSLMCSVCVDDLDIVKLIVKAGADLNEVENTGKSALLIALRDSRIHIANYLIKKGSDVNIVDMLGQSALFLLAQSEAQDSNSITRRLLNAGYTTGKDKSWLGDEVNILCQIPKETVVQKIVRKMSTRLQNIKKLRSKSRDTAVTDTHL